MPGCCSQSGLQQPALVEPAQLGRTVAEGRDGRLDEAQGERRHVVLGVEHPSAATRSSNHRSSRSSMVSRSAVVEARQQRGHRLRRRSDVVGAWAHGPIEQHRRPRDRGTRASRAPAASGLLERARVARPDAGDDRARRRRSRRRSSARCRTPRSRSPRPPTWSSRSLISQPWVIGSSSSGSSSVLDSIGSPSSASSACARPGARGCARRRSSSSGAAAAAAPPWSRAG